MLLHVNIGFKIGDFFFLKFSGMVENYKILQEKYDTSWRKMWLHRPRVRTDGKMQFSPPPFFLPVKSHRTDFVDLMRIDAIFPMCITLNKIHLVSLRSVCEQEYLYSYWNCRMEDH